MVFLSFLLIAPVMGAFSHKRETLSLEQEISAEANIHSSLIRRENRDLRRHGRIEMKVGSDVEFEDIQAAVTPLSQLAAQLPTVAPVAANVTNNLNASLNASIALAVANSITANTSINDALAKAIAAADADLNNSIANNRAAAAAAVNSTRATTTNPPINSSVVDDVAKAIAVAEADLSKSLANNQAAANANIIRAPNTSAAAVATTVAGSTSVTPSTSAARFNVTTNVPSSIASNVGASSAASQTTRPTPVVNDTLAWQAAQASRARPPAPSREELELQAATEVAKKAVKDVSTARVLASKTIRQAKDTVAGVINATLQMQASIDTKDLRAIAASAETVRTAAAAAKTYWSMAYNNSLDFKRKEKAASKADYLKRKLADFVAKVKAEEAAKEAAAAAASGRRARKPLSDHRQNVKIQARMQARKLQATTPEPTEEPVIEPETPTEASVSSDQPTGTFPAGNFTTNATIVAASSATAGTAASAATKATAPSSAASTAKTGPAPTAAAQDVPAPRDAISEDEDSALSVAVISSLTIMVSLMMSAGIYWVCCHGFEDEYDVKDLQFYPTGSAAEPLKEKVVEASAGSSEVKRSSIPAPVAPVANPTPVTASEATPAVATAPDVEPSPVTASGSTDELVVQEAEEKSTANKKLEASEESEY